MSFAQLSYFIAVAEVGNLSRAAKRLHISQPPLTRQMKSLEEELGQPLFLRSKQGMQLLPSGERLLHEARAITERIQAIPLLLHTPAEARSEDGEERTVDDGGQTEDDGGQSIALIGSASAHRRALGATQTARSTRKRS